MLILTVINIPDRNYEILQETHKNLQYYWCISFVPIEQIRLEKGKSIFVYKTANTSNFQPYK